jgi:YfiH family protein
LDFIRTKKTSTGGSLSKESHRELYPELSHDVIYLQFPGLSAHKRLVHAVFTRHGGVSNAPFDTLNTSYGTDDDPDRITMNLKIIEETIGARHLTFMNQIHGKEILVLQNDDFPEFRAPANVDAIITNRAGVALMVKQADCQAVIIYDPLKGVVSNVHCGWRGHTNNILRAVVGRMRSDFGCGELDLVAAIGPSLGPCCSEFVTHEKIFPEAFRRFMVRDNHFDLWRLSRWQLMEEGLKEENIELAGICTKCRTDLFYSYRAEGVTGRFGTVVMLNGH